MAATTGQGTGPDGLILCRPGAHKSPDTAAWMVYESGDILLRRTRVEREAVEAALYHLLSLRAAIASPLLAVRLRPILLPSGEVELVEPAQIYQIPGLDRRLADRGVHILPTTVTLVDPRSAEVILPVHGLAIDAPAGRRSISKILLQDRGADDLPAAAKLLTLTRHVLRHQQLDLQSALDQSVEFLYGPASTDERLHLMSTDAIVDRVYALGKPPTS